MAFDQLTTQRQEKVVSTLYRNWASHRAFQALDVSLDAEHLDARKDGVKILNKTPT